MTVDQIIEFKQAIHHSRKRLTGLAESGKKVIGYFCTYTPVEIIHAAGFIPVRITGGYGDIDKAYQHVPDFICPYMKRALEKTLDGQYDFISGLVQGYSCDAACGMVNVWEDALQPEMVHAIPIPYNNTPESLKYFSSVIDELIEKLAVMGGDFSFAALNESLNLYKQIRSLQLNLYQRRYEGISDFSAAELMTIMDAATLMPPEEYSDLLETLSDRISGSSNKQDSGSVLPVLVSGSLIERPAILDMFEACGGRVVADELCNGLRQILPVDGEGDSPMERLVNRYMNRFPCPSRSRASARGRHLTGILKQSGAQGVIFVIQKFCTPHLSDIPLLTQMLKEQGFPSLLIEADETWQMEAQATTRLEGFFEMIGEKAEGKR